MTDNIFRIRHIITIIMLIMIFFPGTLYPQETEPLRIMHGPYLQNPTETGMTLIWFTNNRCVSHVEFGEGDSLDQKARTSRHGLFDAYTTRHIVRLQGLEPGKTYAYRVVSQEFLQFEPYEVIFGATIASDISSFQALDRNSSEFSFVVINDVHEESQALDQKLEQMDWDGVDLVFLNGDIINHFEEESQIFYGFLDVCVKHFAKRIPFIWVRGNHETRGLLARHLADYVDTPKGKFFYSLHHGPVHFTVLDSGEDKLDSHEVYAGLVDFDAYRDRQAEWLAQEINTPSFKKATFHIVLFHIPAFGGNEWYGEQYLRRRWAPILKKAGIDLLVCAHTHHFNVLEPEEETHPYPVLINGKNTLVRADVNKKQITIRVLGPEGQIEHILHLK